MLEEDSFARISAEVTAALIPIATRNKKDIQTFVSALEGAVVFFVSLGAKHPAKELSAIGNRIAKTDWKQLATMRKQAKEDGKKDADPRPGAYGLENVFLGDPRAKPR